MSNTSDDTARVEEPSGNEDGSPNEESFRIEDHALLMCIVKGETPWQRSVTSQLRKIDANLTILGASVRQLVAIVNGIASVKEPKLED